MKVIEKLSTHFSYTNRRNWSRKALCFTLIAIMIAICSGSELSMVAQAALKPLAYYQKVEQENINKQIDNLTEDYAAYLLSYQDALKKKVGAEFTTEVTLDPNFAKEAKLEGLNNIKTTFTSMVKSGNSKSTMVLSCNNKDLTSLETITTLDNLYYILIPDLSKAFLKLDFNDAQSTISSRQMQENITDFFKNPTSDDVINKILKKYSSLAINQVKSVKVNKKASVTAGGIQSDCTKFTVKINEKNALNISNAILKAANKDTELRDIFVRLGGCTKKEYNATINKTLNSNKRELKALKAKKSNGKNLMTMVVYADNKGNIVGRTFKFKSDGDTMNLGYKTAKQNFTMGFEAWLKSDDMDIRGTGEFTAKLAGVNGNVKLTIADSDKGSPEVIKVNFTDVKYTEKENSGFINGDFNLTVKSLPDMDIKMKFIGDSSKQDFTCDILQSGKSLASISSSAKEVPFKDFNLPTASDKVYDMETGISDYVLAADLKGYLEGIKTKSDVKAIDDLMDTLLSSLPKK